MAKSKKKTSKGAIFAVVVSLITAAAFITGLLTDWYTNFKKYLPNGRGDTITANADTLYAPEAGLLISQSTSDGIMLYSAATPLADFTTYSLDENVQAVQTITATFTPADTTLKEVDYTAKWKNAASAWATGKTVSDYITLTQSSDGSLDCAVSLTDAIGEQIIITCTARPLVPGDWVPSATCTVDYYKRANGVQSLVFKGESSYIDDEGESQTESDYNETFISNNSVTSSAIIYFRNESAEFNDMTVTASLSTGTIQNNQNYKVYLKVADNMASTVYGITGKQPERVEVKEAQWKTYLTTIFGSSTVSNSNKTKQLYNAFLPKYNSKEGALIIQVEFTDKVTNEVKTFDYPVLFNPTALGVKAQGLALDKPGIIF